MKYAILSALDVFSLTEAVNSAIKDGWEPIGGVCVIHISARIIHIYQAMIKKYRSNFVTNWFTNFKINFVCVILSV